MLAVVHVLYFNWSLTMCILESVLDRIMLDWIFVLKVECIVLPSIYIWTKYAAKMLRN
jgi:hypothetical protein